MNPKVTVVTVAYNCLADLKRTVANVSLQTYENLEYVVVDGNSSDGTKEYLSGQPKAISHWISEPDKGIYFAMNKAVAIAAGEWIIFMNAGDEFHSKDAVAKAFAHVQDLDSSDFIFGDRYKIEPSGSTKYEAAGPIEETLLREVVFHQALFTRTALLKARPYNTYLKLAADFEYVVRSHAEGKRFTHVPFAICNFMAGGRSRQQHIRAMIEALKVVTDHQSQASKWRESDIFKHFVANHLEYVTSAFLQEYMASTPTTRKLWLSYDDEERLKFNSEPKDAFIETYFDRIFRPLGHPKTGFAPVAKTVEKHFVKPKVSVVSVVYNDKVGLAKTIESVKSQSYPNIEYIVVDGGSNDGTVEVMEAQKSSIDVAVSERDNGIYDAMNKAIRLACGDYLIFMNAGDTFSSSKVVESVFDKADLDNDVIYGDRNYVSLAGEILHQPAQDISTVFKRMPYCHQSVFVKLKTLQRFMFNETYKFAADYNQVVEMYVGGCSFQYLPITVSNFAEGGRSESGIRPYLETIKIQYDNAGSSFDPDDSVYLQGLVNNISELAKK